MLTGGRKDYEAELQVLKSIYPDKSMLTYTEAGRALGVSAKTVERMARRVKNPLPACKVGGAVRVPVTALAEWTIRLRQIGG